MNRRKFLGRVAITAASAGVLSVRGMEMAAASPVVQVEPSSGQVPFDVTATVTDDGSAEARYLFDWGDGTSTGPQESPVAVHTYTTQGTYEVNVGITDAAAAVVQALPPAGGVTGDHPGGFTVPAGETWELQGLVTTDANVIVNGTLKMRPGSTLRFVNVNEANYVGGGMDPIASDVGLWVMGAGRLDLQGTPKVGWNRTGDDPSWLATDELRVSPTARNDFGTGGFASFTKGSAVPQGRPDVPSAEVLNLTRDVNIEGTPNGRAHIFIRNTEPVSHVIDSVGIRHMGPRKNNDVVLGRWPLHFHHGMGNNQGQVVRDVVVRDAGSHAFVPHATHGVTYDRCIAYDVFTSPYWWDMDVAADNSNDILYRDCVAALVHKGRPTHATWGFEMAGGANNVIRGCVAVGVQDGTTIAGGYHWPEGSPENTPPFQDPWLIEDSVTHNNLRRGIYNWRNNAGLPSLARNFTSYRNGHGGISAGAYSFSHDWENVLCADNMTKIADSANMGIAAVARFNALSGRPNEFRNVTIKDAPIGLSFGVHPAEQVLGPEKFIDLAISGCATPLRFALGGSFSRKWDLIRPVVNGRDALPTDVTLVTPGVAGSMLRVQRIDNQSAWQMNLNTGQVTEIAPFA